VGAELDADAEDEDVEVDIEDKLVLDCDEVLYLLVDLLFGRSGRGRDAGEGAGVGRNGFDVVVRLAAGTGAM
jgi:hypothetical protein